MERKTIDALVWIVGVLEKHEVEYQISGGFAAKLYGSPRELNDIDIDIREKYFETVLPEVSPYVTFGPARFNDGKFDCDLMTLDYGGQEIDISGTDTLRMSNKDRTEWISYPNFTFDTLDTDVAGISLKVVHPWKLIEYKKELDGEHQHADIQAAQAYIAQNGIR